MVDTLAKAQVALGIDSEGFLKDIGSVADLGGAKMGAGLKGALEKFALPGAAAAIAGGLFDIGTKFEESFNTIITKTGATGDALKGLEGNFKTVLATTPGATFQNVADALSEVAVRTHLAGAPLEDLTSKFVELGKVTGTDVAGDVQSVTALFNNFGVAAKNQSAELDVLYKASQLSGVSLTDLTAQMQVAAPAAQILGLNFNQTSSLVAQLTEAGLPASKVMMGLSTEFAKAAKAGKDPTAVIGDMVAAIKSAPDATAAATLAIADFGIGARQAATLVDAVRGGTLDFGATLAAITNGQGGIKQATEATLTLGDRFKMFKNEALVALEPIAAKVLEVTTVIAENLPAAFNEIRAVVTPVFHDIAAAVDAFAAGFSGSSAAVASWAEPFVSAGQAVLVIFDHIAQAVRGAIGAIEAGFNGAAPAASTFREIFRLLGGDIAAVVDFVEANAPAASATLSAAFDTVAAAVEPVASWIGDHLEPILAGLGVAIALAIAPIPTLIIGFQLAYEKFAAFRDVVHTVVSAIEGLVHGIADAVGGLLAQLQPVFAALADLFISVSSRWEQAYTIVKAIGIAIGVVIYGVGAVVYGAFLALQAFWETFHATILRVAMAVWEQIRLEVVTAINVVKDVIDFVLDLLTGKWGKAWHDLLDILANVWNLIGGTISNGMSIIGNVLGALGGIIVRAVEHIPELVVAALAGLPDVFLGVFHLAVSAVTGALGGIGDLLAALLGDLGLASVGHAIQGAVGGIVGIIGHLADYITTTVHTIVGVFGDLVAFIADVFTGKWGAAFDALADIPAKLAGLIASEVANIGGIVGDLGDIFLQIPKLLLAAVENVPGIVADAVSGLAGLVGAALGSLGGLLVDQGARLLNDLADGLGAGLHVVLDFFKALPGRILELLIGVPILIGIIGVRLIEALIDDLEQAVPKVWDWFSKLPGRIIGAIGDAGRWLVGVGVAAIGGLVADEEKGLPLVWGWFTKLPERIVGFIGDAARWLAGVGVRAVAGLVADLEAGLSALWAWFGQLPGRILGIIAAAPGFAGGAATWLLQVGKDMVAGLINGIGDVGGAVAHALTAGVKDAVNGIIGIINGIIDFISSIHVDIPKISVPGLGSIGGGSIGMPKIPDIPTLYQGGIVAGSPDGTLIRAGDRNQAEAIVPLTDTMRANLAAAASAVGPAPSVRAAAAAPLHIEHLTVPPMPPERLATDLVAELRMQAWLQGAA